MANHDIPRVSLGMPVYNGQPFIAQGIESILSQTFEDFELIISDNASTDNTKQICREYAAKDARVRYYRSDLNRGAAWNHNRVFELARAGYFKWNSADDLCAPEFLARCVAALDQDSTAVMACTDIVVIDEHGKAVGTGIIPVEVASANPHQRFRRNIRIDHPCQHIYSLIRTKVLRTTDLIGNYDDSDRVLLAHLSLFGRCILIPEPLLFNRDHPGRFSRSYVGWRTREGTAWFDPSATKRRLFPFWREVKGSWGVIARSPLGLRDRLRCYNAVHWWFRYHKYTLLDELTYYPKRWMSRRSSDVKRVWNALWARRPVGTSDENVRRSRAPKI